MYINFNDLVVINKSIGGSIMFLTRFDPLRDLKEIERRFLTPFGEGGEGGAKSNLRGFAPVVNTREEEKGYFIEVDLPGVQKEDIHIDVKENTLSITGERKLKEEVKEENYYKVESFFGKFQRSFTLPENVDSDAITAQSKDGVLEIFIPKTAPKDAKRIAIS